MNREARKVFDRLVDHVESRLRPEEVSLVRFAGEESDFVRFNRGKVRQAGSVWDHQLDLELVIGRCHASGSFTLTGEVDRDRRLVDEELDRLRALLPHVPEDPYLDYPTRPHSTERVARHPLPKGPEAMAVAVDAAREMDLVGIYAAGAIHRGFASSVGQRNWFSRDSFHFEWTLYHHGDKGIKSSYAGFEWREEDLRREMARCARRLELLGRPPMDLEPGAYRVFLEPAALAEIFETVSWGGFGLEGIRTKTSPLLHFWEGRRRFDPRVNLAEHTAGGVGPDFDAWGFVRPPTIPLVKEGEVGTPLISPRSGREYGEKTNGANASESPESLAMAGGERKATELLAELDRGLYLQRLWYLNWSDRPAARITGMTRFASFWVEGGELVAPIPAMRFDESLYHILGDRLVSISRDCEHLFDAGTYGARSTTSMRLPAIVVDGFRLTL